MTRVSAILTIPGVQSAGLVSTIPFGGDFSDSVILAEGYQMAPGESLISPYQVIASPGYFETLGIPLKSGRTFTDSDTATAAAVVVVDERLAKRSGQEPTRSAVGCLSQRIRTTSRRRPRTRDG